MSVLGEERKIFAPVNISHFDPKPPLAAQICTGVKTSGRAIRKLDGCRLGWRRSYHCGKTSAADFESRLPVGIYEGKTYLSPKMFELMTTEHAGKGRAHFFRFPRGPCYMVIDPKQETFFVLLQ